MTIAEFIAARLDEDEALAIRAHEAADGPGGDGQLWIVTGSDNAVGIDYDPDRVLRTVKAHRSILSQYRLLLPFDLSKSLIDMLELNVREIARIYADHPDFQAEWAA